MTITDWLAHATARLELAEVESAKSEARILASHVLGVDRSFILTHPDHEINELAAETLLQRREQREPLAYILGYREFFGRRFRITPGVLIPRPETEHLVEFALGLNLEFGATILDVGTGPGPIALTLALERPNWKVCATDISNRAIELAEQNAEVLGAKVEFAVMDGLGAFGAHQSFDLVVSNPPYIRAGTPLMPEVGQYEPDVALYGGADGLDYYRLWSKESFGRIKPGGWLAVEIGFDQNDAVVQIFQAEGFQNIQTIADLASHDRIVAGQIVDLP